MALRNKEIAVIGAGVVGLSTAISLQEEFPLATITVFADKFNDETLSSGAGGIFRPEINVYHDEERVKTWCKDSLSHFLDILKSSESSEAGIQLLSGYHLSSIFSDFKNDLVQELVPQWRLANAKELQLFPLPFKGGQFYTTPVIDCKYYLPWMKSKFERSGGKTVRQHISNLEEIPDNYSIIVNCAGLGAKDLLQDGMLTPVRGQTIVVKAPWIKNFYYADTVYIIPGKDYVTLGGIKDYGRWSMEIDLYQKQYIWDKCTQLLPSLKNAEILYDWVGLRPFRPSVRVDTSFVKLGDNYRLIVNNYGHGSHGVALSWGTAQDVKRMIRKIAMKENFTVSKL
ncbi:D-aspartate oxidase like protein [Argiope bruennichi]|uniref:D-aspartate oxidase like protein n=1 Tax=Argiope bruennichi TaxID=94029 RepID=A0A8T0F512_ARGBR|nr:D-aspartate oxidase like protein [Argiope bruennichi]